MRRHSRNLFTLLALAVAGAAAPAAAQGTLSMQGYGYPMGQAAARARAAGSALAELDPTSPVNPAALASWGEPALYFEYLPERRSVTAGAESDRTLTARFPVIAAAIRLGARGTVGVSASTYLDRTWRTDHDTTVVLNGEAFRFVERFQSTGAINDVRLAGAWEVHPTLRVGLGGHVFVGENRVRVDLVTDSSEVAVERLVYSYSGQAVSAGVEWRPVGVLSLAASGRVGTSLKTWSGDTMLRKADLPARASGAIAYSGIGGSMLVARVAWEGWSSLGDPTLTAEARDATEIALGAEIRGPRWFGREIPLRAGIRRRTLPFVPRGVSDVRELGITAGFGLPLARGRARLDFVFEHDRRDGDSADIRERALLMGFGFTVRP